jgi:hypothetical protein
MKKAKRYIAARLLHMGCSAIDQARVTTWYLVLNDQQMLTEKEHQLIQQRMDRVKAMVTDVRKIANHIERQAKTPK